MVQAVATGLSKRLLKRYQTTDQLSTALYGALVDAQVPPALRV